MALQAIITKFLGPTDTRGSRVKAWCDAGSITVAWDYTLNTDDNHRKAAEALRDKLGWNTEFYGGMAMGGMPDNTGCCFVFVH